MKALSFAIDTATNVVPSVTDRYAEQVSRFEPDITNDDNKDFPALFGQYQEQVGQPSKMPNLLNVPPGSASQLVQGDAALTNYLQAPLMRVVDRIVVHGLGLHTTSFQGEPSLRALWNWDVVTRGYRHIASHWVIDPSGGLWTGRPLAWTGAHAGTAGNVGSIGVAFWIDGDKEKLNYRQLETFGELSSGLSLNQGFSPANIRAHDEYSGQASCPGTMVDFADLLTDTYPHWSYEQANEDNVELTGEFRRDKFRCAVIEGCLWAETISFCNALGLTSSTVPWTGLEFSRPGTGQVNLPSVPDDGRLSLFAMNRLVRLVQAKEGSLETCWFPLRPVALAAKLGIKLYDNVVEVTM